MDKLKSIRSKRTLKEELAIEHFHYESEDITNINKQAYRIIEDKLTGEFFKVTYYDKAIRAGEDKFVTMGDFIDLIDGQLKEMDEEENGNKKKYRVFLRIFPEQGSESSLVYTEKEIEVFATDKDDAKRQWEIVYGKPFYYYPTAEEIG